MRAGPDSYPNQQVRHEYSDTTGSYRIVYHREDQCLPNSCNPGGRDIITDYQTDAAGRITSVSRDGKSTSYAYADSTTSPSVTETRPDGTKTLVFLDDDGSVRTVAHEDANEITLAVFDYARDDRGRITSVDEQICDSPTCGTYRVERVEYDYNDGNLSADDLDDPDPNNPELVPAADKLYYSFLADLGGGLALRNGDPNRLISERRYVTNGPVTSNSVQYHREYRYDQEGNRLVMVEKDTNGVPTRITRYNYFYPYVTADHGPYLRPGTPIVRRDPVMDYSGRGRNKLLSTQSYAPSDPDSVNVVAFKYAEQPDHPWRRNAQDDDNIIRRIETDWTRQKSSGDLHWFKTLEQITDYRYFNGNMQRVRTIKENYCSEPGSCEVCEPPPGYPLLCNAPSYEIRNEFHNYDVFGRRVNRAVCNRWCWYDQADCSIDDFNATCSDHDLFQRCKVDQTQYDYDGLSNTILVERRSPYAENICDDDHLDVDIPAEYEPFPITALPGDRFISSYTYGPLGPIFRTDEDPDGDTDGPEHDNPNLDEDTLGDSLLSNNRDYYYLREAMGGHVGLIYDHDNNPGTPGQFAFAVHDAFGNKMSAGASPLTKEGSRGVTSGGSRGVDSGGTEGGTSGASSDGPGSYSSGTGSFRWRGGEGSVTDSEANLVHMQARHYDPTLGRFLQADSLMLASFTTQGTNRYLYTENDPVNRSDPSGRYSPAPDTSGLMSAFFIILGVGLLTFVGVMAALAITASLSSLLLVGGLIATAFMGLAFLFKGFAYYPGFAYHRRCILDQISTNLNLVNGLYGLFGGIIEGIGDILQSLLDIISLAPSIDPMIPSPERKPIWDRYTFPQYLAAVERHGWIA